MEKLDLNSPKFNDLLHKYARLMLVKGSNLDPGQPVVIEIQKSMLFFADIIKEEALKIGVTDVMVKVCDINYEKELYEDNDLTTIKNDERVIKQFDRSIIEECYEKNGAVIYIQSSSPDALKDIDSKLQDAVYELKDSTNHTAEMARRTYRFPWLITTLAEQEWADLVFPNDENSLEKLWDAIFKCNSIYDEDPVKSWDDKIKRNKKRAKLLTDLQFKELIYRNSLGTNLKIGLPENHIWLTTGKKIPNKDKEIVCNMPSEEIFTSPDFRKTEGIVYSSKPLVLNGKTINGLFLEFVGGRVVRVGAETNEEEIKRLVFDRPNNDALGEVALVDFDSPISQSGLLFYKTLFDENAACHLALGDAFPNSVLNGSELSNEELISRGLNKSKDHTDFMIGTSDLEIIGVSWDGDQYQVFRDGNFALHDTPKVLKKR